MSPNGQTMWVESTASDYKYVSTDYGVTWNTFTDSSGRPGHSGYAGACALSDFSIMYHPMINQVYKSTDMFKTAGNTTILQALPAISQARSGVVPDSNDRLFYAGLNGKGVITL
jgi:hypothetical protein